MVKLFLCLSALTAVVSAEVTQVHLGISSSAVDCVNGIAVSFATDDAKSYQVSATAGRSTITTDSTFVNYSVAEPEYNYTYMSPFLHTALLCNLAETTKYTYTIGSDFTGSFISLLHPGSDSDETILGVIGDPGDTTSSETTFAEQGKTFEGKHIQALVIAGDYSYANGQHLQWDNWFREQQNLTSLYPLTGINGNHETITSSGYLNMYPYPEDMELEAENYLGYINRVYSPISEDAKTALHTWYSLDIGLIHCVFLDDYTGSSGTNTTVVGTEEWLADRNAQLDWVKADLENVDRSVTPWVVVFKHNPFYNTWSNHQCQCSPTIFDIADTDAENCWNGSYYSGTVYSEPQCGQFAKWEEVFSANGVNAMITGHVHAYERTAKIYKNKEDSTNGIYHITTGSGGNYEGHAGPRISSSLIPSWSLASNNVTFGGSRIIATRDSFRFLWFANDISTVEAVPTDGFTIFTNGSDITTWPQNNATEIGTEEPEVPGGHC
ncbi:Purple acid phosphatase 18 [Phytophthora citrophthora]|uniref:Purple acid phosphatase n=1 Tax=Phytophthora citrophthora TaxID=4793 RepID=A0AAD9G309_9STRA|nr:Purple acid phosphatase 18 [Phytophthora citrophthora]